MDIQNLFGPIIGVALIMFRVGAFWLIFPFVMPVTIPPIVRVTSGMILSLAIWNLAHPHLPTWTLERVPTWTEVLSYGFREIFIGLGLGFVARWIYSSAIGAAQWVGTQMGFSMPGMMNPDFEEGDTSWSTFNAWVALMVYLGIGGHWMTIQALADSYRFSFSDFYTRILDQGAGIAFWTEVGTQGFAWMLKLSGPLVVVILLLQAALGVLAKFVPQINLWSVSIPVTLAVGVIIFSMLSPMYGDALIKLFNHGSEHQYLFLRYLGAR